MPSMASALVAGTAGALLPFCSPGTLLALRLLLLVPSTSVLSGLVRAMFLRVPLRSTTHYFSGTDKDRDGPHVTVAVDAVELLVQKLTPNHRSTASALPRKLWPRVGANSDVLRFVSFLLLALFLPRF